MGLSMSRYVLSNLLNSTSMLLFLLLHLLMLQLGNKNFNLFTLSSDSFFFCLQVEMPCSKQQPMTKSQLIHWPANQWLDLATASNWLAKQQSASDILLRLCSMWFANSFKQKRTHTHTHTKTTTLWHLNDVLLMWLKAFHKAILMYLKNSIYWFRDFTFYQCSPSCMPGW